MTIIDVNLPTAVALRWRIYGANGIALSGGSFTATLVDDASGNSSSVFDGPVTGYFDASGRLVSSSGEAFQLLTNDTTTPTVAYYNFVAVIPGVGRREFRAVLSRQATFTDVDADAAIATDLLTVTLSSIVVGPVLIGQTISGVDVTAGSTIVAVNAAANTVTLSKLAIATSTLTSVTIGGVVNVQSLLSSVA